MNFTYNTETKAHFKGYALLYGIILLSVFSKKELNCSRTVRLECKMDILVLTRDINVHVFGSSSPMSFR